MKYQVETTVFKRLLIMIKRLLLFSIFLISLCAAISAQTDASRSYTLVPAAGGVTVKYTDASASFDFTVAGEKALYKKDAEGGMTIYTAKSQTLFVQFFKTADVIDPAAKLSPEQSLESYFNFRALWDATEAFGSTVVAEKEGAEVLIISDRQAATAKTSTANAIYWSSAIQGQPKGVFYAAVIIGKVLMLTGANYDNPSQLPEAQNRIKQTLATLALLPPTKKPSSGKTRRSRRKVR